jgi:hypothetical protein
VSPRAGSLGRRALVRTRDERGARSRVRRARSACSRSRSRIARPSMFMVERSAPLRR